MRVLIVKSWLTSRPRVGQPTKIVNSGCLYPPIISWRAKSLVYSRNTQKRMAQGWEKRFWDSLSGNVTGIVSWILSKWKIFFIRLPLNRFWIWKPPSIQGPPLVLIWWFVKLNWQLVTCQVIWREARGEEDISSWQAQLVQTCQVPLVPKTQV